MVRADRGALDRQPGTRAGRHRRPLARRRDCARRSFRSSAGRSAVSVLAAPGGLGREVALVLRLASIPGVVEHFGQPFMALGTRLALGRWRGKLPDRHIAELSAMNSTRGSARTFARTVRHLIDWRGQRRSFLTHAHEIADLPPIAILWGAGDSIIPIAHARALVLGLEGVRLCELAGLRALSASRRPAGVRARCARRARRPLVADHAAARQGPRAVGPGEPRHRAATGARGVNSAGRETARTPRTPGIRETEWQRGRAHLHPGEPMRSCRVAKCVETRARLWRERFARGLRRRLR